MLPWPGLRGVLEGVRESYCGLCMYGMRTSAAV
jgi:hypothetical protein